MSEKYHDRHKKNIFLIAISAVVIIGSFVVGSQFVRYSMAQDSSQMGQDVGRNETGNQTANQSAQLGDPSKLYVPSQLVK